MRATVNPAVLVWTRINAGYSISEVADKFDCSPDKIAAWETGDLYPTIKQLRELGKLYGRPSAFFYLSATPVEDPKIADYRVLPECELSRSPAVLKEIRKATERRQVALDLFNAFGEVPPETPWGTDVSDDPLELAQMIRSLLSIDVKEQARWKDAYEALNTWIRVIEQCGILVFQISHIPVSTLRGYSISSKPLPIIGINGKDAVHARIFTLFHELCHIIRRVDGVCNLREPADAGPDYIEVFCNKVAGETLVPRETLLNTDTVLSHNGTEWTENELGRLSRQFHVSKDVITRRLLALGKTDQAFYEKKHEEYSSQPRDDRGYLTHDRRVLRDNGRAFTNLVLSAYHNDLISSRDLSNILDGAKLVHIEKIENRLINAH